MPDAGIYLEVDASDLQDELKRLRSVMSQKSFERVTYFIFRRTGKKVRKILADELPQKYEISKREVSGAVKNANVSSTTGLGVGCSIPVEGKRRDLGGTRGRGFPAYEGRNGWAGKSRRLEVKVLKGKRVSLPQRLDGYGGQPPFRNLSAEKLHKLVFTREGKERLPIRKVQGIAIPQMPMNRSRREVQDEIRKFMQERIEHEFQHAISGKW